MSTSPLPAAERVADVGPDRGGAVDGSGGHCAAQDEARAGDAVNLHGGQLGAGDISTCHVSLFPLWKVGVVLRR